MYIVLKTPLAKNELVGNEFVETSVFNRTCMRRYFQSQYPARLAILFENLTAVFDTMSCARVDSKEMIVPDKGAVTDMGISALGHT